jgi:two-component sensor histidine kinase
MTGMLVRREPISASLIRRRLVADLQPYSVDETSLHEITLVATELVGNAIRHSGTAERDGVDVTWQIERSSVTIVVADPSVVRPQPRVAAPEAEGGRGLTIVAALSDEWGVDSDGAGKRVWARVPIRRS